MKYLILVTLLMFSSVVAQDTTPSPYMDNMSSDQICGNVYNLALLMSRIYIYQGKEPKIYNSLREHSEFEKRIIRETKRRVQELIGGENGLTDPESISRIVARECMNNLSNRRLI